MNLKTGVSRKQSTPDFPKNKKFLHARAYQGVRKFCFSGNLACFVFLKYPFWDSPFCLITNDFVDKINCTITVTIEFYILYIFSNSYLLQNQKQTGFTPNTYNRNSNVCVLYLISFVVKTFPKKISHLLYTRYWYIFINYFDVNSNPFQSKRSQKFTYQQIEIILMMSHLVHYTAYLYHLLKFHYQTYTLLSDIYLDHPLLHSLIILLSSWELSFFL